MDEIQKDEEYNKWFSTYGMITAERILGTYNIIIPTEELLAAIKKPVSFYHQVVQVPLKNVLNGIVFQQAYDYHVYAQKLYIDYLLSNETSKGEGEQGANTRETLEQGRLDLIALGGEFHLKQLAHDTLIARSQSAFIQLAKKWNEAFEAAIKQISTLLHNNNLDNKKSLVRKGIHAMLINIDLINPQTPYSTDILFNKMEEILNVSLTADLKKQLLSCLSDFFNCTSSFNAVITHYLDQTNEMSDIAKSYRNQFYNTIIRINELIRLLPEYKIDSIQDQINRESLNFDKSIGDTL